jgi:hypothetical protein
MSFTWFINHPQEVSTSDSFCLSEKFGQKMSLLILEAHGGHLDKK